MRESGPQAWLEQNSSAGGQSDAMNRSVTAQAVTSDHAKGRGSCECCYRRASLGLCKVLEAPPRNAPVCRESLGAAYLREHSTHKTPSAQSQKKCVYGGVIFKRDRLLAIFLVKARATERPLVKSRAYYYS